MRVIFTMRDRKELEAHAWREVKHLNAPRHVRLMVRDQLVRQYMDAKEAEMLAPVKEAQDAPDAR